MRAAAASRQGLAPSAVPAIASTAAMAAPLTSPARESSSYGRYPAVVAADALGEEEDQPMVWGIGTAAPGVDPSGGSAGGATAPAARCTWSRGTPPGPAGRPCGRSPIA